MHKQVMLTLLQAMDKAEMRHRRACVKQRGRLDLKARGERGFGSHVP